MAAEKTQRDTVVMYRVQIEALLDCSSLKDVKSILAMILEYGMNGEDVECPEHLRMIWRVFKSMIDGNNAKWDAAREKYINAGKASAEKRKQSNDVQRCSTMFNDVERCSTNNVNVNVCNTPINGSVLHNRAHAQEHEHLKLTDYPKTAEDVLAICKAINSPMTESQAQAYIDQRTVADWHQGLGGSGRKISVNAIPADIRRWIDRDKAEVSRSTAATAEKEAKRNATAGSYGRYVPKH